MEGGEGLSFIPRAVGPWRLKQHNGLARHVQAVAGKPPKYNGIERLLLECWPQQEPP